MPRGTRIALEPLSPSDMVSNFLVQMQELSDIDRSRGCPTAPHDWDTRLVVGIYRPAKLLGLQLTIFKLHTHSFSLLLPPHSFA